MSRGLISELKESFAQLRPDQVYESSRFSWIWGWKKSLGDQVTWLFGQVTQVDVSSRLSWIWGWKKSLVDQVTWLSSRVTQMFASSPAKPEPTSASSLLGATTAALRACTTYIASFFSR